jgi:hypothetical protein
MPICPNCEYEYVEGVTFCPDCQTPLVDETQYVKPEEWDEENWEVVYTSSKIFEVEMIKDNLESAGIKAAILNQKDRSFPATGDLAVVKLLVQRNDIPAALNFIQSSANEGDAEENS